MELGEKETNEFKIEAFELLEAAEKSLLALENGADFKPNYDLIFRTFHNLKGASGLMDFAQLQTHMHQLENILTGLANEGQIQKETIDFFLKGIDAAKLILEGKPTEFSIELAAPKKTEENTNQKKKSAVAFTQIIVIVEDKNLGEKIQNYLSKLPANLLIIEKSEFEITGIRDATPDLLILASSEFDSENMNKLRSTENVSKELPILFFTSSPDPGSILSISGNYKIVDQGCSESIVAEVCRCISENHYLKTTLEKSVRLLKFQFSDLTDLLVTAGRETDLKFVQAEMLSLLEKYHIIKDHPLKKKEVEK